MKKLKNIILLSLLLCSFSFSQLNPQLPPASNFDLNSWKLQTLDSNYQFFEIYSNQLVAGYSSNFFYTNSNDGSMTFKVPSNGEPTNGSSHPRVELRQMSGGANWLLKDTAEHYLTAQCRVITVASAKPQLIIGQIHGSQAESELLKLRWVGYQVGKCTVDARFQMDDSARTEYGVTLASGLSLGALIDYSIKMFDGKITVTVNGVSASQTYSTSFYGSIDKYYFKAGNYLQFYSNDPNVYGLVQFYKLSLNSQTVEVESEGLGTEVDQTTLDFFEIRQNYPNPFNPSTTIRYAIPTNSFVTLKIYDLLGNDVAVLVDEENEAGFHQVEFDGSGLASGVYFYALQTGSFVQTKKFILLK